MLRSEENIRVVQYGLLQKTDCNISTQIPAHSLCWTEQFLIKTHRSGGYPTLTCRLQLLEDLPSKCTFQVQKQSPSQRLQLAFKEKEP